jgi:hypothetical protein
LRRRRRGRSFVCAAARVVPCALWGESESFRDRKVLADLAEVQHACARSATPAAHDTPQARREPLRTHLCRTFRCAGRCRFAALSPQAGDPIQMDHRTGHRPDHPRTRRNGYRRPLLVGLVRRREMRRFAGDLRARGDAV